MGNWQLDPYHTQVEFAAKHLGMMTVRGHFAEVSSVADIDPDKPEASSVEVTIQTASIRTHNETRDNDLRSSNFFDTATHPEMTFRSTGIRRDGDGLVVDGDLTIRGVTKPVSLTVEVNGFGPDPYGGTRAGFSARGEINRNDFGVSFNAPVPGGVMISERIQIEIEAEAVLKKD